MDKNNQTDTHKKDSLILDVVFLNNPSNSYVFKKVTKISQAAYLISDLLNKEEPLRLSLRLVAHDLINSFKNYTHGLIPNEVTKCLLLLKAHLILGHGVKLISDMNASILSKEVDKIALEINELGKQEDIFTTHIGSQFFDVEKPAAPVRREVILSQDFGINYKGHEKDRTDVFNKYPLKTNTFYRTPDQFSGAKKEKVEEEKENRREQILSIIKENKDVSIKDISKAIRDCSEKTIQRELINLLALRLIKKTGERRWSRYFIA